MWWTWWPAFHLGLAFLRPLAPHILVNDEPFLSHKTLPSGRSWMSHGALTALVVVGGQVTEAMKADEAFLHDVHHVLLEVQVMEGNLVCPETGRRFPIKDGIPNMLLHEDEI